MLRGSLRYDCFGSRKFGLAKDFVKVARLAQACQLSRIFRYQLGRGAIRRVDAVEKQGTMGRVRHLDATSISE